MSTEFVDEFFGEGRGCVENRPLFMPAPPPGGGYLVLNDAQISNFDLVCALKSAYPRTKIYAQKPLPTERPLAVVVHPQQEHDIVALMMDDAALFVRNIGRRRKGPTGLLGYYIRRRIA